MNKYFFYLKSSFSALFLLIAFSFLIYLTELKKLLELKPELFFISVLLYFASIIVLSFLEFLYLKKSIKTNFFDYFKVYFATIFADINARFGSEFLRQKKFAGADFSRISEIKKAAFAILLISASFISLFLIAELFWHKFLILLAYLVFFLIFTNKKFNFLFSNMLDKFLGILHINSFSLRIPILNLKKEHIGILVISFSLLLELASFYFIFNSLNLAFYPVYLVLFFAIFKIAESINFATRNMGLAEGISFIFLSSFFALDKILLFIILSIIVRILIPISLSILWFLYYKKEAKLPG